jgi:hypothetical protein
MAANNMVIEDAITLDQLRVFLAGLDGRFATSSLATTTTNGLMSAADKARLDGLNVTSADIDAAVEAAFAD